MNVAEFTPVVFLASLIAGFVGALTGLGGGVIVTPVLVLFLHVATEPGIVSAQAQGKLGNANQRLQLPWVRHEGYAKADGVIIFVHGVLGDARTTWTNGRTFWPDLLTRDSTFDGQNFLFTSTLLQSYARVSQYPRQRKTCGWCSQHLTSCGTKKLLSSATAWVGS